MRFRPRLDARHREIVEYMRKAGYSAWSTAALGNGFPDLVVAGRGWNLLVEVENPKRRANKSAKTLAAEAKFATEWRGPRVTVAMPEQLLDLARRLDAREVVIADKLGS